MKRLLSLLILCAPLSWGAISYVSSASAQANTVNFTTPTAGDLIVVCAHRDGSNTAPSLISGYTNHTSQAGGSTNSWGVMWKTSAGNETSTGTATNATSIAVAVYRGHDRNVPLGTVTQTSGTGANPTLTYGALTPQVSRDTSSWVIGCGAGRLITSGLDAPTGMTQRTVATDISLSDTNAAVSSWSAQTDATTASGSSGWITDTIEIRAAQLTAPSPNPLVQHKADQPSEETTASPNTFKFRFPNPTLANNFLQIVVIHTTGRTITVTDDTSTSWTAGPSVVSGNGIGDTRYYYRANAPAGIKVVTVVFSGTVTEVNGALTEWYGVATSNPIDGTATGQNTSTQPLKSGSITTTQNGDLIFHYVNDVVTTYYQNNSVSLGAAPDGGFALLHADLRTSNAAQYGVQASAGAINPGLVFRQPSNADPYNSITIALKIDGSGTAPSGMRIVRTYNYCCFYGNGGTGDPIQFPTSGNLIVAATTNSSIQTQFTAVADTKSNSYTEVQLDSTTPQLFYAVNSTPSLDMVFTATGGSPAITGNFLRFFDIIGADAAAYDTAAWANGTQGSAAADVTNAPQITPGVSSGLTINILAFGTGPGKDWYGPTGALTGNTEYSNETDGGIMNYGDSFGLYWFTSNAQQSWNLHTATPVASGWIAQAVTFKAAATGGTVRRRAIIVQ